MISGREAALRVPAVDQATDYIFPASKFWVLLIPHFSDISDPKESSISLLGAEGSCFQGCARGKDVIGNNILWEV
jgi:hypothetical protein